jgi:hypothetical protein
MSQKDTPAPEETPQESAVPDYPQSIDDAFEAADAALNPEQGGTPETPAPKTPAEGKVVEEPEHVRWVKSQNGMTDEKGQPIIDRVLKQNYELNKQNQATVQAINQIQQWFQIPTVKAAIEAHLGGGNGAAPAKQETAEDLSSKTDEQIFRDAIREEAKKVAEEMVRPLVSQLQFSVGRNLDQTFNATKAALDTEFGVSDDGTTPVYETIKNEVGAVIANTASRMGKHPHELLSTMAMQGTLFDALKSIARDLLYPKVSASLQEVRKKATTVATDQARRANLPGRGSPGAQARKPAPKVNSFEDAARMAEEELAAGR